jgi:hypothetical protein
MLALTLLYSVAVSATASAPSPELPAGQPPWGAALLEKVSSMETLITEQSRTIEANSARISALEGTEADRTRTPHSDAPVGVPGAGLPGSLHSDDIQGLFETAVSLEEGASAASPRQLQEAPLATGSADGFQVAQIVTREFSLSAPTDNPAHRRAQDGSEICSTTDLTSRLDDVTKECCDEPAEDCSSGWPATCNIGCANVVRSFWAECQAPFVAFSGAQTAEQFRAVVQKCEKETAAAGEDDPSQSLASAISLVCSGGGEVENCLPNCNETSHGRTLLAALDGEDSVYRCERHHGLYSWLGPGGYIGRDVKAFVSSVIAAAQGFYGVVVAENDAQVGVDLTTQPGQIMRIAGDPAVADDGGAAAPAWGTGGFTVIERGILSLTRLTVSGDVHVLSGGTLHLSQVRLP